MFDCPDGLDRCSTLGGQLKPKHKTNERSRNLHLNQ